MGRDLPPDLDRGPTGEFAQEVRGLVVDLGWDDDLHLRVLIAAPAVHARGALAAEAELLVAGRAGGDRHRHRTVERGDLDAPAEDRLLEGEIDRAVEVVPALGEDVAVAGADRLLDRGVRLAAHVAAELERLEAGKRRGLEHHPLPAGRAAPRAPAPAREN